MNPLFQQHADPLPLLKVTTEKTGGKQSTRNRQEHRPMVLPSLPGWPAFWPVRIVTPHLRNMAMLGKTGPRGGRLCVK